MHRVLSVLAALAPASGLAALAPASGLAALAPASGLVMPHNAARPTAARMRPPAMVATYPVPLMELLEEKQFGPFFARVSRNPKQVFPLLQDAGGYGVLAYGIVFVAFYSTAALVAEAGYHAVSGGWFDPRLLLQEDGADGKAEALAVFATFYLACKPFGPAKLGGALVLTPDVRRFVQQVPALLAAIDAVAAVGAQASEALAPVRAAVSPLTTSVAAVGGGVYRGLRPRAALKAELLELADKSAGGTKPLSPAEQARFEEIRLRELPALCPVEAPTRSELFSGVWECRWTDEKELNFAVRNGLLGLPWVRTYQAIDVAGGSLENVLEFEGGELRVGSTIAPDDDDGTRFNFAFSDCALTWRTLRVPLPPVGRGWGELLYLDDDLRIQRDIRGDMLVATKVR